MLIRLKLAALRALGCPGFSICPDTPPKANFPELDLVILEAAEAEFPRFSSIYFTGSVLRPGLLDATKLGRWLTAAECAVYRILRENGIDDEVAFDRSVRVLR